MVQVLRKTKIEGEVFENVMSFSDQEWKLIQEHYPMGGVSFERMGMEESIKALEKKPIAKPGRDDDDDKPNMKDYSIVKDRAMQFFKDEDWQKALYYFEAAHKLKSFGWLNGKINQCKKNIKVDSIVRPTPKD